MNTAHNTLIQFLHTHEDWQLDVKMRFNKSWQMFLRKPNQRLAFYSHGISYEAACADLAVQLPKL